MIFTTDSHGKCLGNLFFHCIFLFHYEKHDKFNIPRDELIIMVIIIIIIAVNNNYDTVLP